MSSPAGTPYWQDSAAPAPPQADGTEPDEDGVTLKPMRLKILYTFDHQNKTNCLARWPHVLQIRTVAMDDSIFIGVVELKTCIQAIVQCSPELVAKLGQDYTIYAYDYSEYDTPLVGQGMLSWALAASSPTPDAPAHQSRQLITGRVCKNIQGLFSNGVKETLEVKLRLVPVPTVLQSEYVSSMEKYRELSRFMPSGFDHNEWLTFLQSNPNISQLANKVNGSQMGPSNRDGISMEVVNQLLSPSLSQQASVDPFSNPNNNDGNNGGDSRASTPAGGRKGGKVSRPSSRNSVRMPRKPRTKSIAASGNTSGYEEGTDGDDGPPAKKRAKIVKADWNSKSSFGTATDSLRVAASTAGSLRLFRPIAVAPSSNVQGNHLKETPRAPTPVPSLPKLPIPRDRAFSQSGLRRDSIISQFAPQQQRYQSPYLRDDSPKDFQDQPRMSIESAMTSPEKNDSPSDSPVDIASSPPILHTATPPRSSPPCPSSPVLPQMPRTDSGFMSGDMSELFGDEDDLRPDEDVAVVAKYKRRGQRSQGRRPEIHHGFTIHEVNPGPMELLPTKMLPRVEPNQGYHERLDRSKSIQADNIVSDGVPVLPAPQASKSEAPRSTAGMKMQPPTIAPDTEQTPPNPEQVIAEFPRDTSSSTGPFCAPTLPQPSSRMMSRTASAGSLTLPTVTASDPVLPPSHLHRSQTWSDAPYPTPDHEPSASYTVTKSTLAKKQAIRARLENAIANGETPPYCINCGAIDTPTWRKAWAQECKGDPGYHEYSDEPGRVMAIDILERDEDGKPTTYRLIKKSLLPAEDKAAFSEILMCNPCGIWMSKYKTQRPEEKWRKDYNQKGTRDASQPVEKKKRISKAKKSQNNQQVPTSDAYLLSDAVGVADGQRSQVLYNAETDASWMSQFQQNTLDGIADNLNETVEQPDLPAPRPRASSMQPSKKMKIMTSDAASAALRRAIQSSPARWLGTRHSPIELEEDLGTTRRLLFPSPRKDGSPKILGEVVANSVLPVMHFQSLSRVKSSLVRSSDKENCPPAPSVEDGDQSIIKLLEGIPRPERPTTPTQKSPRDNPFKTPTRPTPSHRPITRSQSRSTKSARHQMMPQRTPSRTPTSVRRSPRNHQGIMESPFTATLNRLLSEANDNQSPSHNLDLGIDFSLPDLSHSTTLDMHSDTMNWGAPHFDANHHDFFSTDVPMPSSPPKLFDLYEDPMAMGLDLDAHLWSDAFPVNGIDEHADLGGLLIDASGHASFSMENVDAKFEHGAKGGSTGGKEMSQQQPSS